MTITPRGSSLAQSAHFWIVAAVLLIVVLSKSSAHGEVVFAGDPIYPVGAAVFTVDPEGKTTAQRGIAIARNLRQTFLVPTTFDVTQIVAGINVDDGAAVTAGLEIRVFEVADVLAGTWAAGNLVKEFTFATGTLPATLGPASTVRMGLTLSGTDIFTLQARTAPLGYGIEFSTNDDVSTFGQARHTSSGSADPDYYAGGRYYTETGGGPSNRDLGIALSAPAGLPGDTDGDGIPGEYPEDFTPIRMNFRKAVTQRTAGDLVPNGVVDFADFREWLTAHGGAGASLEGVDLNFATSVPEPATWLGCAVVCGGWLTIGRRRRAA